MIIYKGFQDSLEYGNATPVELVYDRSREMEIGILQQNLISTLMSSTSEIMIKKSIEKYLQELFPDDENEISDDIFRAVIKKEAINRPIKWTSVVGEKNDTKLGLIQAVAGTAILMLTLQRCRSGNKHTGRKGKRNNKQIALFTLEGQYNTL